MNTVFIFAMLSFSLLISLISHKETTVGVTGRLFVFATFEVLLAYWGVAIQLRISEKVLRHCLIHIDILFVLWVFVRTLKYEVFDGDVITRYLWYAYYIPMIFSVCFAYIATDSMKYYRNKISHTHRKISIIIVSGILSAFVMTNEFHGRVFGVDTNPGAETHEWGYWVVALFVVFVAIICVAQIPKNKSLPLFSHRRAAIPYVVIGVTALYCTLIIIPSTRFVEHYIDFTSAFMIGTIALWESLIYSGFVPSNIDYEWCFNHTSVNAQILDKDGNGVYRSAEARPVLKSEFNELVLNGICRVNQDTELVLAPINGGYVVWERNIRDINRIISELTDTQSSIEEATSSLRKNIDYEKRQKTAFERNRLYDITFSRIAEDVKRINGKIDEAHSLDNEALRKVLRQIDIIGVYIKRKSNLIILKETDLFDYSGEINLCFKETFDNLKDAGVDGKFYFNDVGPVSNDSALIIYEVFEIILEEYLDMISCCNVILSDSVNAYSLMINMTTREASWPKVFDRKIITLPGVFYDYEEDNQETAFSFFIPKKEVNE